MQVRESELRRDDGVVLHWWLSATDSDAPLVVCTHGGAMDHRMWEPQMAALTPGRRFLTYDVRGHGMSHCSAAQFSLDLASDDLIALIDAADVTSAVLVGHSFGATISQLVALRHPDRVRALVGIGAACATIPAPLVARVRQAMNPLALSLLGQERLRAMFADMAGVTPEVKRYAQEAIAAIPEDVFAAIMRTGFGRPQRVPQGYKLGIPLLLLQGEKEPYGAFLETARQWAARDEAQLVIVPNAAHNANQDSPDFVNGQLEAFLSVAAN